MLVARTIRIHEIARALEELAPARLAEEYDNVGLLVGEAEQSATGVLVALDITPEVLAEAARIGASLVVSHHPIWFRARKSLRGDDFVSRQILAAIRGDLALYACHTNLDSIRDGVNGELARRLELRDLEFLEPREDSPGDHHCAAGHGMIGELPRDYAPDEFLAFVRSAVQVECLRYAPSRREKIRRVAICGGAGSFLLEAARARKADAFLTADVTYHKFFDAEQELLFADIGHYESEQFCVTALADYLKQRFPELRVQATTVNTNPVRYFTGAAER
jgi:dinuclear metal center YbgI/SA1388 family protein